MEKASKKFNEFDSTNLLVFLFQWKKTLIITSIIAAIVSIIFALTIREKYKSTVILFPSSTNSISKALLADDVGGKQDILQFGEEEEAEQLLQILNSDEIKTKVISKYNLFEHYRIDTTSKYPMTDLYNEFEDNIHFKRTEFMSVQIDVMDEDPQMAADIANDIAALLDSVKNRMQQERAQLALKIVQQTYVDAQNEVRMMEDSLDKLRALGINDYESQSEVINDAYAKAIVTGKQAAIKSLEEKIQILAKYGGAYVSLRDDLEHLKKQLSHLKTKYEEAKVDAGQTLPHKFIVNNAYKAEKKSYPIRWLIVVISVISTFLLTVISIIAFENFSKLRK